MFSMLDKRETNEISNKNRQDSLSIEMSGDYGFKYIPESHFKHIVKNIQRQRCKEDEERVWASFVKEQELNNSRIEKVDVNWPIPSIKGLLEENMQDVDMELKRLQEDALPEQCKAIHNYQFHVETEKICAEINETRNNFAKDKLHIKCKNMHSIKPQEEIVRAKAKKSLSDSSVLQKKFYTNQLLHATNHFEDNSNSDLSNGKKDIINIQPDPFMVQKILSMQKKIAELLDEISFRLFTIPLPDGDNDLKRRQQQTVEFGIRFSRNYLYNLNRLATSVEKQINTILLHRELKHHRNNIMSHQDIMKEKLIAVHQLLIQALTAYCKHIPNSIHECHLVRLQSIFQIVCKLCDICDKVEISNNYFCSGDANICLTRNNLQEKCNSILSKLKLSLEKKRRPTNYTNIQETVSLAPISLRNRKPSSQKDVSSRLSMYDTHVKTSKNNQRKKIDCRRKNYCAKERKCNVLDIKSMYNQQCSVAELQHPSPVTHRSSSRGVQIDFMRNANYLKEDDIKTTMDGLSIDSEHDSNIEIETEHTNEEKIEQGCTGPEKLSSVRGGTSRNLANRETDVKVGNTTNNDNLIKKVTSITGEHLSTLVPVISELMALPSKKAVPDEFHLHHVSEASIETLLEFLQKCQTPKDSDTKASVTDDSCERLKLRINDKSSEIQPHSENVQLICMTSADEVYKMKQCDASCQADYNAAVKNDKDNIPVSLDSKCTGILLKTSKQTEQQFSMYKHKYQQLSESKPMYSSNTHNKPWDIVAWISDKLMEELIGDITEELQMKNVIQKLFEMEFQEF